MTRRTQILLAWWRDRRRQAREYRSGVDLDEYLTRLRLALRDRGECPHCGHDQALKQDGRVRAHGTGEGCPGADQLPAAVDLGLLGGAA